MTPQPTIIPRRPDQPAVDLTDYVVVHRAMTVDVRRLAEVAACFALQRERPVPQRAQGLRDYLGGVSAEIHSHHQVEDDAVWPVLLAAAEADPRLAALAELTALTDDHHRLGPLLDAGAELAEAFAGHPGDVGVAADLAATLHDLSELLDRHIADEERDVFPLIAEHVRVADYAWLQQQFRRNLSPCTLPFVVPWVVRHSTAQELPALVAEAGWELRVLLQIFQGRFMAREQLVFGAASAGGAADRRPER
jgi:iron-sulfur cluster repair protein YtfE (RIC family)